MKKRERLTAEEHLARLHADPEWVAARAREEVEDQEFLQEIARAEAPLVRALRQTGYELESVWDLVNTRGSYPPEVVAVLLAHLPRPYPPVVREGIARALAVPEAKAQGWALLTRLFREETVEHVRDGIAVAIAGCANREVLSDVIALTRDRRCGASRVLLMSVLARSKDARAREALMELRTDPDLEKQIALILKRRAARDRKRR